MLGAIINLFYPALCRACSKKINEFEKKIKDYLKEKYKVEKVVISKEIDKNIIGGFIIKTGDDIVDQSISGKIKKLRENLIK